MDPVIRLHARMAPVTIHNVATQGMASFRGMVVADGTTVSFVQNRATEPLWTLPIGEVDVEMLEVGLMARTPVRITHPRLGEVHLAVSRKPFRGLPISNIRYRSDDILARNLVAYLWRNGAGRPELTDS